MDGNRVGGDEPPEMNALFHQRPVYPILCKQNTGTNLKVDRGGGQGTLFAALIAL